MLAKDCKLGQRFKHKMGNVIEVIDIEGSLMFEIADIGLFEYIDDDYILYEI